MRSTRTHRCTWTCSTRKSMTCTGGPRGGWSNRSGHCPVQWNGSDRRGAARAAPSGCSPSPHRDHREAVRAHGLEREEAQTRGVEPPCGPGIRVQPVPAHGAGIKDAFDLDGALRWGTLPRMFSLDADADRRAYLRAYALTYLKGRDCGRADRQAARSVQAVSRGRGAVERRDRQLHQHRTGREGRPQDRHVYFSILEDTLVGFLLPAFHRSIRKQQRVNPKFYFFDPGVKRALDRTLDLR